MKAMKGSKQAKDEKGCERKGQLVGGANVMTRLAINGSPKIGPTIVNRGLESLESFRLTSTYLSACIAGIHRPSTEDGTTASQDLQMAMEAMMERAQDGRLSAADAEVADALKVTGGVEDAEVEAAVVAALQTI
eukprot:scaffold33145_cov30-Attheya_sp.AAC.2